ncbi:hypothetical protein JXO59_13025 [candidate division KSB1 bacterium]|nr:hypothetical protein [candidate division KSB1 bacterium]
MPELVTHAFSAYFLGYHRWFRPVRWIFYFAVLLPDLLSRPLYILRPQWVGYTVAVHTPIFAFGVCLLLAELFAASIRNRVRWALLSGCALHFLLDLFQRHLESGYIWLFPFSWESFEIGLFWPEAPLRLVPIWIGLMILFELIWWQRQKRLESGQVGMGGQ